MTPRLIAGLVLTLAGFAPATAEAGDLCVDVTVTAPFAYANSNRCVSGLPGDFVCDTVSVEKPPYSAVVTVCLPNFPVNPPPAP